MLETVAAHVHGYAYMNMMMTKSVAHTLGTLSSHVTYGHHLIFVISWRGLLDETFDDHDPNPISVVPRRQKSAPDSPLIGHRVSAALLSRDAGDRRATEGDPG